MTLEMIKQEERREGLDEGIAIGFDEGVAVGEERGIAIGAEQVARSMLAEGFPVEQTARLTGLSLERVRQLAETEPEKDK